jgi:predicted exporter
LGISLFWICIAALALTMLWFRLQLSFDLSAFFPQKTSLSHDILLEQMKDGPGSRLLVIGLSGDDPEILAEASNGLKVSLSGDEKFINVLNGEVEMQDMQVPAPLDEYYLLLADFDFSETALKSAIEARQRDLAFGGGTGLLELMARDPFLHTIEVLERLAPVSSKEDIWFAEDGSAVLLAETEAGSIDLIAQAQAVELVKNAFADLPQSGRVSLEITGVGAFGVELQDTIRAEAQKRTILAISVLLLVLVLVYRKPRLLLLAALPIGMGFLVGLAVVTVVFGSVHGITLAFGFTLMGVAIDYPLHLFSHARQSNGQHAIKSIWPTLRLGALSTAIAYIAIALAGSNGLAQLGVFTACGVVVAALVTRTWLPLLLGDGSKNFSRPLASSPKARLIMLPAITVLILAFSAEHFLIEDGLWEDSLSSLSPIAADKLQHDGMLRSAAGTADMRYQLVLHSPQLESLLLQSELTDIWLQQAVDDRILGGWQSVTRLLPSQQLQKTRQEAIPPQAQLQQRVADALQDSSFKADAFAPFEENAASVRDNPLLGPEDFTQSQLRSWLDSHLIKLSDQWVALITVSDVNPDALGERIKSWPSGNVSMVDLQQSANTLVRDYRHGALKTISVASVIILALLFFGHRQVRQIAWIAATVAAALATTVVVVTLVQSGLTIIHLVALLLVMGLGLDYALFLSRQETRAEQGATRHAVVACALTTTLTFGILAASSIPVLKFMGLTVAVGSAASFLLAFAGSSLRRKTSIH